MFDLKTRNMVVINDLMLETYDRVTKLFSKESYHCNTYVMYLVQNVIIIDSQGDDITLSLQPSFILVHLECIMPYRFTVRH